MGIINRSEECGGEKEKMRIRDGENVRKWRNAEEKGEENDINSEGRFYIAVIGAHGSCRAAGDKAEDALAISLRLHLIKRMIVDVRRGPRRRGGRQGRE